MAKAPCKGCEFRAALCWGSCERYLAYRAAVEAERKVKHNGLETGLYMQECSGRLAALTGKYIVRRER